MNIIKIFTDGGARGNPGGGACAFVVYKGGVMIHGDSRYLGKTTNNVAEYTGVVIALEWIKNTALDLSDYEINFFLDSQLVVRQLTGSYKIKNKVLINLSSKVKSFEKQIDCKFSYNHIPREENTEADLLVNQSLDENP